MERLVKSSWLLMALWIGLAASPALADENSVAIVVHPKVPLTDVSMDELRKIFLADQQFWEGGSRISVLIGAPGAKERRLVLDRVYRMTEREFRRYWIAKIFRAEVPSGPKIVLTSGMALEFVTAIPGSISFIPASAVNDSVKVLSIDGLMPDQPNYPL